jgi:Polysaccharide biosynthesis protein C-terminal
MRFGLLTQWYDPEPGPADLPGVLTRGLRAAGREVRVSSEEMVKADDEGDYFRVSLDARSLEYELYFSEGEQRSSKLCDYPSANTERLGVDATKELLLPEMQRMAGALA